jgi:hypothetical protein
MEDSLKSAVVDGNISEVKRVLNEYGYRTDRFDVIWMNKIVGQILIIACKQIQPEIVSLLLSYPSTDVNSRDNSGWTALMYACYNGSFEIIRRLLAHPNIDVNKGDNGGITPFMYACIGCRKIECIKMLIRDLRINLNKVSTKRGHTALYWAMIHESEIIKWWIASGREMIMEGSYDYISFAEKYPENQWKLELVELLKRHKRDPEGTTHQVRVKLGWYDERASEVFAPVVFVSDGLLRLSQNKISGEKLPRFFKIALGLPVELQMILCYRAVGLARSLIPLKEREQAFKDLVRGLKK